MAFVRGKGKVGVLGTVALLIVPVVFPHQPAEARRCSVAFGSVFESDMADRRSDCIRVLLAQNDDLNGMLPARR
jgi:hypothetical protein